MITNVHVSKMASYTNVSIVCSGRWRTARRPRSDEQAAAGRPRGQARQPGGRAACRDRLVVRTGGQDGLDKVNTLEQFGGDLKRAGLCTRSQLEQGRAPTPRGRSRQGVRLATPRERAPILKTPATWRLILPDVCPKDYLCILADIESPWAIGRFGRNRSATTTSQRRVPGHEPSAVAAQHSGFLCCGRRCSASTSPRSLWSRRVVAARV